MEKTEKTIQTLKKLQKVTARYTVQELLNSVATTTSSGLTHASCFVSGDLTR
jgi:hypothetical protein